MDVNLFRTFSHVTIMTWKVGPFAEGGAVILIKECSIKAIDVHQDLEKARLIIIIGTVKCFLHLSVDFRVKKYLLQFGIACFNFFDH